jgi:transcriptional regulator with XRE-family HTH domain
MVCGWGDIVRGFRLRHGLSQQRMGELMGVSQRTISRWERGEDNPSMQQQKRLRDLGWEPPGSVLRGLAASIVHCPAPRALSCTQRLRLQMLSKPAIQKRPSIVDWIGRDLAPIATGILQEMLDDRCLQKGIASGEIAAVISTTRSVLDTTESAGISTYRTTVSYFFHDGTLYSDAISVPVPEDTKLGYQPVTNESLGTCDLLAGDLPALPFG